MYVVRNNYLQKAYAHIMRHGQFPFNEGGLNQDALESIAQYGLIPYDNYTGLKGKDKYHDHQKLLKQLQEMMPDYAKKGIQNGDWKTKVTHALDKAMEKTPTEFDYDHQHFTPETFLQHTTIHPDDYVHITSFNHKPFYKNMVLDLEWNISNKAFYNVPLDDFWATANMAIDSGYTLAVELDVSEKGYSGDYGIAVVPEKVEDSTLILSNPLPEKAITQAFRQQEYENFHTYNDHNQHIVGKVTDQNGKTYFIAKNSWRGWGREGYIYISEAYFKLKVLYYTVHKEVIKGESE
jgi:bleomycin hydrolase